MLYPFSLNLQLNDKGKARTKERKKNLKSSTNRREIQTENGRRIFSVSLLSAPEYHSRKAHRKRKNRKFKQEHNNANIFPSINKYQSYRKRLCLLVLLFLNGSYHKGWFDRGKLLLSKALGLLKNVRVWQTRCCSWWEKKKLKLYPVKECWARGGRLKVILRFFNYTNICK